MGQGRIGTFFTAIRSLPGTALQMIDRLDSLKWRWPARHAAIAERIKTVDLTSRVPGESMLEALTIGVQTPDELLVARAREGYGPAREELFHRHRNDSYRVAYRLLGHEQDALDVVQEAMLKAFSALGDFDGRSGFRTWLLKIVTNTALDWGRRRKRRPSVPIGGGRENGRE